MSQAVKQGMLATIDAASEQLLGVSHTLHSHPELAWNEYESSALLASNLQDSGFTVERGSCDLPTAFVASVGSGDLCVAICAEYDALPGMGHACGHNIIAAAALGAATGLAPFVDELGITLKIIGTPAEEGGGGKIFLLERGAFDGVDLAMMIHPGPVDVARAEPFAVSHVSVAYHGHAAHAAAYPDEGVNAADAFTVAQVAIGLLRQQLPNSVRVHGLVSMGGEAPNAIPEETEGRWYVRANSLAELETIEPSVRRCFEAGAMATGTTLTIEEESPRYAEFVNDDTLLGLFVDNAHVRGRSFGDPGPAGRMNRASTDMGNVSSVIPSIHPYLGIDSLPALNHQKEFAAHCVSEAADKAVLDGATLMAWTVADVATSDELREHYRSKDRTNNSR